MLQNAYLLAKIGADTAENKQRFAEFLPTDALWQRRGDAARTVEPLERAIEDKADLLRMASVLSLGPHDGVMLSVFSDY